MKPHAWTRLVGCAVLLVAAGSVLAVDSDGDGVDDSIDVCCNTPAGIAVNAQGRPIGDLDNDCDVDQSDFGLFQANMTGALSGGAPCLLPNGTACTLNSQCASGLCVDGVCCDTSCNAVCKRCNITGSMGTCTNIAAGQDPDNECPGATNCNGAGACQQQLNGSACASGAECQSGFCVDGVCCNSACSGTCQACNNAGSVGTCSNIAAGADPANECAGAAVCNGAGACKALNGSACSLNSECLSGFCVDGVCCNAACTSPCQKCNLAGSVGFCSNIPAGQDPDNECAGSAACNGAGTCTLNNGSACSSGAQCASGFCVDGVCCNSSCTGLCKACNVAGSVGTCSNIVAGADPANECAGPATCNGAGACTP